MQKEVSCKQCDGDMIKTKKTDSSIALQLVGVLVFILGVIFLFFFPIGTIVGVIMMIVAARMGYKRTNIWKCKNCGYFFERV